MGTPSSSDEAVPQRFMRVIDCSVCGRQAAKVSLVGPSATGAWRVLYSGIVAGSGPQRHRGQRRGGSSAHLRLHAAPDGPVVGTKRPRTVKPKHTTWTASQLRSFLDQLNAEDRWSPLWELAAGTGIRRGELLALRWSDLDLDRAVMRVERSVTQIGPKRSYGTPKKHERREVALDGHLVSTLKSWRKLQVVERLAMGESYQDADDLVFTWQDGRPVPPDYVTALFRRVTSGLELPRLRLHELRQTHATLLLREGVPVHVVAKRLGHKDPSVTLNVYADAIPDDDGRAVDTFTRAVWGA